VLFVDAINVKIRDGRVANRPVYVVMAVTAEEHRDSLGIWAGDGGEGAKYWLRMSTDLKNRGVDDVLLPVCDGLKGLPEAVETVWPRTVVQTCAVHLLRNSFRHAAHQDWDKIAKLLRPVCTAPNEAAATERFGEFQEAWGKKYPAVIRQDRTRSRSFPQRGRSHEVRLHGADGPGPDGEEPQAVDHALEGTPERLPDRLRRPAHPGRELTPKRTGSAVYWTHPNTPGHVHVQRLRFAIEEPKQGNPISHSPGPPLSIVRLGW
jgi:putative transposase